MPPLQAKQLATQLFMLLKTGQIHDPKNRAFALPLDQFRELLDGMISADGPLTLESADRGLYLNEEQIRSDISTFGVFNYLHEEFSGRQVGGIRFLRSPSADELEHFIRLASRRIDAAQLGAVELNLALHRLGVESIEFVEPKERASHDRGDRSEVVAQKKRALKNYLQAIDVMRSVSVDTSAPKTADTRKAKRVVYNLVDICINEGFSFLGLSNIKNYDEYTFNHSVNVCILAIGFGKNLGLSKKQLGQLGVAGLYHDYGKLAIPKEILNKPGRFEPEEWEVMKTHPLRSIKTLLKAGQIQENDIKKMIAAFEHHRNYDCTGYPDTGVKKKMNFYSRVVAIADAYDAMTTNRVYQRAMLPTMALKILTDNAGTKFDPLLVKAFINTLGIFPVGSLLRLSDGTLGVVTAVPRDPRNLEFPSLRIVADAEGRRLEEGPEVDLALEAEKGRVLTVETLLRPEDYRINVASYLFDDVLREAGAEAAIPASPTVH